MYKAVLDRLKHDEENPMKPRETIDKKLSVLNWSVPGGHYVERPKAPGGPPDWWQDDEEASQSFLEAMGVTNLG